MARYTCKWCGTNGPDLLYLTNGRCSRNPHMKQHEPMNATEELSRYSCKWCGTSGSNPLSLATGQCRKSPHPNKAHELLG